MLVVVHTRHDTKRDEGTVLPLRTRVEGAVAIYRVTKSEISLRSITQTSPNPTSFANALNGVLVCGGKSFI